MEISFSLLRSKEIINVFDGKRLGRAVDIVFDKETAKVLGVIVPGEKKIFRKSDDIFIPIELIKKIGDDVILVKFTDSPPEETVKQNDQAKPPVIYARYKRSVQKE